MLGEISDELATERVSVRSRASGIVIGRRLHPIVYQAEALVHVAEV